jgi:hypothetical protein
MEPIKPKDRKMALDTGGTEDELEEYERLLGEHMAVDPYAAPTAQAKRAAAARELRLAELHHKLFSPV